MNLFTTILEKLGIKKPAPASAPAPQAQAAKPAAPKPAAPSAAPASTSAVYEGPLTTPHTPASVSPKPVPMVDVVSKLEKLAAESKQKLNWKVSIVDMMKLLDMDSSFEARKELAEELGCPAELMTDSAKMNTWLHKTVLQKIAENGGNIPASMLD